MIAYWFFLLGPVVTGFVTAHELRPADRRPDGNTAGGGLEAVDEY